MKVKRYSANGTTHSNGMGATSCEIWLVMDSESAEPHAGSMIHKNHTERGRPTGSAQRPCDWSAAVPAAARPDIRARSESFWLALSFADCCGWDSRAPPPASANGRSVPAAFLPRESHARPAQTTKKTAIPPAHSLACIVREKTGSSTAGYASRARSEPAFETE